MERFKPLNIQMLEWVIFWKSKREKLFLLTVFYFGVRKRRMGCVLCRLLSWMENEILNLLLRLSILITTLIEFLDLKMAKKVIWHFKLVLLNRIRTCTIIKVRFSYESQKEIDLLIKRRRNLSMSIWKCFWLEEQSLEIQALFLLLLPKQVFKPRSLWTRVFTGLKFHD